MRSCTEMELEPCIGDTGLGCCIRERRPLKGKVQCIKGSDHMELLPPLPPEKNDKLVKILHSHMEAFRQKAYGLHREQVQTCLKEISK